MAPPLQRATTVTPVVRRVLVVVGTGAVFLLLVALGLGLAALLTPGDTARPEPVAVHPPPPPRAEPPPPPASPPPAVVREAPRPPPQATPPPQPTSTELKSLSAGTLTLPERMHLRREVILGIGELKEDLARCPADPVQQSTPPGRAAVVLETESVQNAIRVAGSTLEADVPVNDGFVSCARRVLEGKQLAAPGTRPGVKLRVFLPVGPNGNSLSLSAASLAEVGAP